MKIIHVSKRGPEYLVAQHFNYDNAVILTNFLLWWNMLRTRIDDSYVHRFNWDLPVLLTRNRRVAGEYNVCRSPGVAKPFTKRYADHDLLGKCLMNTHARMQINMQYIYIYIYILLKLDNHWEMCMKLATGICHRIPFVIAQHYSDAIMSAIVCQITGVSIVYSTVCSSADKKNIEAPRDLPLWGEFTGEFSSQKPATQKMFPFEDVIMTVQMAWCRHRWLYSMTRYGVARDQWVK